MEPLDCGNLGVPRPSGRRVPRCVVSMPTRVRVRRAAGMADASGRCWVGRVDGASMQPGEPADISGLQTSDAS